MSGPARRPPRAIRGLLVLAVVARAAGGIAAAQPAGPTAGCGPPTYTTGDAAVDALQTYFGPVVEANARVFSGRTGPVYGFGAGSIYPQIWLRDSATLIPVTRYLYSREFLTSWLVEHLSHQRADGSLWDWIAAGPAGALRASAPHALRVYRSPRRGTTRVSADKNSSAVDQESSAVWAAGQVFALTGDVAWLTRRVAGRPLLDRLDAALGYLLEHRFDAATGLVTGAFTADWGDVSVAHADQQAIYLDAQTPIVVGLYANALFSHAADQLASLQAAAGQDERARHWQRVAATVRTQINRTLWQEDRGFYRLHRVVAGSPPVPGLDAVDESELFAMGGNALAVLYGVADERQTRRIVGVAEARRRRFGLDSVAGVLLPPYPDGFFAHPLLERPFEYQNGGQWDWWAGRFLQAMFQRGYGQTGRDQLRAIAARVARAGGLYEWYTRDGEGRGSGEYAGNAGSLAAAIFQGLFGLDSTADGLNVTVRLDTPAGDVGTCEPSTGRRVQYSYRDELSTFRRISVQVSSNAPGQGRLAIRLPRRRAAVEVWRDGLPIAFEQDREGEDAYVSVRTSWEPHEFVVHLR